MLKRKKTRHDDFTGKSFQLSDDNKRLIRGSRDLVYKIESVNEDFNSYVISWTTKLGEQKTTYTRNHAHQLIHEKSWIIIK